MLALLAPILVFGLVIFVHEFGHFVAAKALGVYAPRFSIGFGPALWRRRRGETEYVLAILPLGGYVRMASRHDETSAFLEGGSEEQSGLKEGDPGYDPKAMIPFGPLPVPEHRWFESKSLPARLVILLAGVTMNALLAVVVAIGLAVHYGRTTVPTRVVGAVHVPAGGEALAALHPGDTVFRVNGDSVRDWTDVLSRVALSRSRIVFGTQRGNIVVPLGDSLTPLAVAQSLDYWLPPVVDSVVPDGAAAAAGLQPGDSIEAVNGVPTTSFSALVDRVTPAAGSTLVFTVGRHGQSLRVPVTPRPSPVTDPVTNRVDTLGRIGVAARQNVEQVSLGLGEAVVAGSRLTWQYGGAIVGVVHDLIVRKASVKELGGPIAITRASVDAARSGWGALLRLIALLSINVAVLNLLPIPILDGGNIVINVIETAKGSPFSDRTRENILRVGLVIIGLLFVLVMFNDSRSWLGSLFSS
jgi:regulator of sigma E protease